LTDPPYTCAGREFLGKRAGKCDSLPGRRG
jgi:hypothetical protein